MQSNKMATYKNTAVLAAIGVLIGAVSVVSPGAVFDFILAIIGVFVIYQFSNSSEKYFLVKLFVWGLFLRVIVLLVVQYVLIHNNRWFYVDVFGGKAAYLFGDDGYYTLRSWGITQHIQGASVSRNMLEHAYRNYGYTFYLYIISFFYYLFGFSPISVTFINCILSVLTGLIYYFIAKDVSDNRSARLAAIMITFFPSIIVWSIANLKDTIFMFLMGAFLLAFIKLVKTDKIRFWVVLLAVLFMQFLIRPKFILFGAGIASWACLFYLQLKKKIKLGHIFLAIIAIVVIWPILGPKLIAFARLLVSNNTGVVRSGGFCYRIYDDWVYGQDMNTVMVSGLDLLIAILRGWVHFFMEPFPWKIQSVLSVASFPQVIIWYIILPFSISGIFIQLKTNREMTLALLAFLLSAGTIFAMTGGNIGTDFRMRDMLSPLIMLFSAIGFSHCFRIRKSEKV